jgi:hypothetical protein
MPQVESDGRKTRRGGGAPARPTGGALLRVLCLVGLVIFLGALSSCTACDNRMIVAASASCDPVMDSNARQAVMTWAVQSISADYAAGRHVMPFIQVGGHFQVNDIAMNKSGVPAYGIGADGKAVPLRGGLHVNNEASLKDVGQSVEMLAGIWGAAKAAVASAAASETASKEATKQLQSTNATKVKINADKLATEEAIKTFEPEAVPVP